jgi:hypothetical protein
VTPTDWDWNDAVSAVSIETHDEMYMVEPDSLGEELFNELDSEVEVTGFVKEDRDGTKGIMVTNYEVLAEAGNRQEVDYGYDDDGEEFETGQGESPI